jgi:lipopolysaccharide/colanic/teichoic acid biosynthesis glycosyltransferase
VALQDEEFVGPTNSGAVLGDALPAFRLDRAAKRLGDIVAATVVLVLLSPLLLFAFVALRLSSPGPVLVGENRYGYKNRPIRVLKFRLVDACAESGRSRPRLTRVGRILSQTGIDELPRLASVLRGEMSFFGPPPSAHPRAVLNEVKPGMIRWAEIVATRERPPDADAH